MTTHLKMQWTPVASLTISSKRRKSKANTNSTFQGKLYTFPTNLMTRKLSIWRRLSSPLTKNKTPFSSHQPVQARHCACYLLHWAGFRMNSGNHTRKSTSYTYREHIRNWLKCKRSSKRLASNRQWPLLVLGRYCASRKNSETSRVEIRWRLAAKAWSCS